MKKLLPFLIGVAVLYWIARPYVDFTFNLIERDELVLPTAATQPAETAKDPTQHSYDDLMALSNDVITYGPGTATNGNHAPYAPGAQKSYGKYDAHFIESTENTIYLTFDCGTEAYHAGQSITGMILDVLKAKNVKAVFFVTGDYVEKNPTMVRRIISDGHVLGNHGTDHKSMPYLGIQEMEEQIMNLHKIVKDDFGYTMKFFRPPEGAFSLRSLAVTQNLGYETVHWSFAYADWDPDNQPDTAAALEKILSCHHDGAIYLLHGTSLTNAQVLGDVIDGLRNLGYRLDLLS